MASPLNVVLSLVVRTAVEMSDDANSSGDTDSLPGWVFALGAGFACATVIGLGTCAYFSARNYSDANDSAQQPLIMVP